MMLYEVRIRMARVEGTGPRRNFTTDTRAKGKDTLGPRLERPLVYAWCSPNPGVAYGRLKDAEKEAADLRLRYPGAKVVIVPVETMRVPESVL